MLGATRPIRPARTPSTELIWDSLRWSTLDKNRSVTCPKISASCSGPPFSAPFNSARRVDETAVIMRPTRVAASQGSLARPDPGTTDDQVLKGQLPLMRGISMPAGNNQGGYPGSPNAELPVKPTLSAILRKPSGPQPSAEGVNDSLNARSRVGTPSGLPSCLHHVQQGAGHEDADRACRSGPEPRCPLPDGR